jgi:uncharacterized iron-regulated membrane protein
MNEESLRKEEVLRPAYARIWRWHFFAGLFLSPTLAVLAVTGLIYLFKPQVEPALYRRMLEVQASPQSVSAQAQLESAMRVHPDAALSYVVPSPGPGKSAQVFMKLKSGERRVVYVNPHDGGIAGQQSPDRMLMQLAHDIHGSLLLGKTGEVIMELTAGWAFILVATGLYLWWPKGKKGWGGILWPRFGLEGRAWWRDLHAVPAFYLSGLILLFLATGVPWTGITGKWIFQLGQSTGTGSPPGFGGSPFRSEPAEGRPPIPLDSLVAIARERLPESAVPDILLPKNSDGAAVIRWKAPSPFDRAYLHVDIYSGKVIADYRWKDFGVIGKAVLMAVALHEGTWFGVWNQVLNSCVALGVLLLSFTGVAMWWKRRPAGAFLAAPQAPEDSRLPGSLWVLIGLACLFVPVAGLSLAAVLAGDFAVRRVLRRKG